MTRIALRRPEAAMKLLSCYGHEKVDWRGAPCGYRVPARDDQLPSGEDIFILTGRVDWARVRHFGEKGHVVLADAHRSRMAPTVPVECVGDILGQLRMRGSTVWGWE